MCCCCFCFSRFSGTPSTATVGANTTQVISVMVTQPHVVSLPASPSLRCHQQRWCQRRGARLTGRISCPQPRLNASPTQCHAIEMSQPLCLMKASRQIPVTAATASAPSPLRWPWVILAIHPRWEPCWLLLAFSSSYRVIELF